MKRGTRDAVSAAIEAEVVAGRGGSSRADDRIEGRCSPPMPLVDSSRLRRCRELLVLRTDEAKLFGTEPERRGAAAVLAGLVHRAGRVQGIGILTGSRTSRAGDPIQSGEVQTMPLQKFDLVSPVAAA